MLANENVSNLIAKPEGQPKITPRFFQQMAEELVRVDMDARLARMERSVFSVMGVPPKLLGSWEGPNPLAVVTYVAKPMGFKLNLDPADLAGSGDKYVYPWFSMSASDGCDCPTCKAAKRVTYKDRRPEDFPDTKEMIPEADMTDGLRRASSFVRQGWIQRVMAATSYGRPCGVTSPHAVKFCAMGALIRSLFPTFAEPERDVLEALGYRVWQRAQGIGLFADTLWDWNDRQGMTAERVCEGLLALSGMK